MTGRVPETAKDSPWRPFGAVTLSVSAIASFIGHLPHRYPLTIAASMDLSLTVPLAWYWLMVRSGFRSAATVPIVAFAGLWRASFLFPEIVPGKIWIGAAIEIAVIAGMVSGLRKARRDSAAFGDADPLDRILMVCSTWLGPSADGQPRLAAKAIATEFSVFYYAFGWKQEPHVPQGSRPFSLHQRSAANVLLGCLAAVSLLEIVPVHLLLRRWPMAAWTATALGLWGSIWMLALSRSFALRPTLVTGDGIVVRFGLLFRLLIPAHLIDGVEPGCAAPSGTRIVPKAASPVVCIRFRQPLTAELPVGFTRQMDAIGLSPDDDRGFLAALESFTLEG